MTTENTATIKSGLEPRSLAFQALLPLENRLKQQKTKTKYPAPFKADEKLSVILNTAEGKALPDVDRRLTTTLAYGVLRYWTFFDRIFNQLSNFPPEKTDPKIRLLFKLGGYQLLWLETIPDHAALNTTMELAKELNQPKKSVSFLNGLLRSLQRQQEQFKSEFSHSPAQWVFPETILALLKPQYNADTLNAMAKISLTPPPLTLRINTLKTTMGQYEALLTENSIHYTALEFDCLALTEFVGSPVRLPGYKDGLFMVQDINSAQVSHWLDPQPDETIIDLCAAPGAKTTHIAAKMSNQGSIIAIEPSENRIKKLKQNLERLGVTNVKITQSSGEEFKLADDALVDKVLVDAPCTGLGTIRQHPEILLQFNDNRLAKLLNTQQQLIQKGFDCLKPGGTLIYSTCSLLQSENTEQIETFLAANTSAALVEQQQLTIQSTGDGFYMAKIQKL